MGLTWVDGAFPLCERQGDEAVSITALHCRVLYGLSTCSCSCSCSCSIPHVEKLGAAKQKYPFEGIATITIQASTNKRSNLRLGLVVLNYRVRSLSGSTPPTSRLDFPIAGPCSVVLVAAPRSPDHGRPGQFQGPSRFVPSIRCLHGQ